MLERTAGEITVREMITALEGPIAVTTCLESGSGDCSITHCCPMRGRWHKVNAAIVRTLDEMTLAELLHDPLPAKKVQTAPLNGMTTEGGINA